MKFHKTRALEAKLVHADGQTDRQTDTMKLTVAFREIYIKTLNYSNKSITKNIALLRPHFISFVYLKYSLKQKFDKINLIGENHYCFYYTQIHLVSFTAKTKLCVNPYIKRHMRI
jgi:hypothetical protein